MKFTIKYHYADYDKECILDYTDIELFLDDELISTIGDSYHDRGHEWMQGFITGYIQCSGVNPGDVSIERENIADRIV